MALLIASGCFAHYCHKISDIYENLHKLTQEEHPHNYQLNPRNRN